MMRLFLTYLIFLFFASSILSSADEEGIERAWSDESERVIEGPYVYGSFSASINLIHSLTEIEGEHDSNPFDADDPKDGSSKNPTLDQIAPRVPISTLPACLPSQSKYRDLSKLSSQLGIVVKSPEWIVLADHDTRSAKIYFCTTLQNADIIEHAFFTHCCHSPFQIISTATLVSVPNQGIESKQWNIKNLAKLSPEIHARYGIISRSGERALIEFTKENDSSSIYEIEPTLNGDGSLLDLRFAFSAKPSNQKVHINLITAVTHTVAQPLIVECGAHGVPLRNYFLILDSSLKYTLQHDVQPKLHSLKKIDGSFAFQTQKKPQPELATKLVTRSYESYAGFLHQLRKQLADHASQVDGDPSETAESKKSSKAPVRLKDLKHNEHHSDKDLVYNITPQLRFLGIRLSGREKIYFNSTKNRLIVNMAPKSHLRVISTLKSMHGSPSMIRAQAQVVRVERKGLGMMDWTMTAIASANPKLLKKYSLTMRDGNKATLGDVVKTLTSKDPETGKKTTTREHEFEAEAILGENRDLASFRFIVNTKPLGDQKTSISVNTALNLMDGKPVIIELGHPNSSTHTYLLILNADIITTDGSFYRNLLKPVESVK